jgi:hypothetical protein
MTRRKHPGEKLSRGIPGKGSEAGPSLLVFALWKEWWEVQLETQTGLSWCETFSLGKEIRF